MKESLGEITFTQEPKSTTVNAGNSVSFNCSVTTSGTVRYNWQFMGQRITSSSDGRITIRSDGTLEFTSAQPQDDGEYVCVAVVKVNGVKDRKKSQKAVLTVRSKCIVKL